MPAEFQNLGSLRPSEKYVHPTLVPKWDEVVKRLSIDSANTETDLYNRRDIDDVALTSE